MSASRPFQGDTGEGVISRHSGSAVAAAGRKSALRGTLPVCRGKVTKSSAIPPPPARFFSASPRGGSPCSADFVPVAPREVEKLRVFRLRPPVFSSFARAFFVRRPGRPLRGVKCAVSRAYVSRTRQPLFVFSLHRFTHPEQCADDLPIVGEDFAFPPSPRSSLPHGGCCRGQQAQQARSEIGQFLLMHR